MPKIKAAIAGAAGYTGGELIRILLHHPDVEIAFAHSKSHAGHPVYRVHEDLRGETDLVFSDTFHPDPDVLFLCLGHGEAVKFLRENPPKSGVRIIDLSQDFRIRGSAGGEDFVYGLPELNREAIGAARSIANPGCFATAIQLGLLPLAKAGLLSEVHTTGITGSTGAGQGLSHTSHFSWRSGNIQAYKTLTHQHLLEIGQTLSQLQPLRAPQVHFVPWRGDFPRGIFISSQLDCSLSAEGLHALFEDFYHDHPFCLLSGDPIFMKQVVNTNKCMIQLEKHGHKLVVHSAIDNLLKGASGQAVQNMNLMFGLGETSGLQLKASYF